MKHLEDQIQASFFQWLQLQYPKLFKYCFHIPNGGYRNILEATRLKRQGVKSGVADVFVMIPNDDFGGLWIEFKTPKGKQTETQKEFEQNCIEMCYDYQIAHSLEEAQRILKTYMEIPCDIITKGRA
jgi:hypothetical protein